MNGRTRGAKWIYAGNRLSDFFNSTVGVKQERPLSPTQFGLCIDELKEWFPSL